MDRRTGDCTQGQSAPVSSDFVVKLEPQWSMEEEAQDQPSAVYSPAQPMCDSTSGSPQSLNTSHACRLCSAVFMLPSSLEDHMETFHRGALRSELPVASRPHCSASEHADKMLSGQGRCSTQMANNSGEDSTSFNCVSIKVEPPWSIEEEPQSQPSADVYSPEQPSADVYSPVQPMSDNTCGSLLSLNTHHVCQCCSATFVLFSSLELHVVTFHGETLCDLFSMYSSHKGYGVGYHDGSSIDHVGNGYSHYNQKGVEEGKEGAEDNDTDRTDDQEEKARRHVCDVCGKGFTTSSNLKTHKMIHLDHKPFVCDMCDKGFSTAGNLKAHKLTHTGHKAFVCDVCCKTFTTASHVKAHRRIHTGERPYKCPQCDADFKESSALQRHIKTVHAVDRTCVCDICGKAFFTIHCLKQHKNIHTGEKPYACDVCGTAFSLTSTLNRHKKIHTGVKPFECTDCGKKFARMFVLKKHQLIHTGERPYTCDVCGSAFSMLGTLKKHQRTHTDEKPYVCTECGKRFALSYNLKTHQLTHTGEKPHTCDVCGAAFSLSGTLKKHSRVHTGEKPYECLDCGKKFARSANLKRHQLTHAGEKALTCDGCGVAFSDSLKEHQISAGEKPHLCTDCDKGLPTPVT